jgi:Rrf2 family protein
MHVPIQVDYGIRALVDLTERRAEGVVPVRTSEIARRQDIPEPFLARVMLNLRNGGMVESVRGPQGGHALAKNPSEITMAMVMDCLGGVAPLLACLDDQANCNLWSGCSQKEVWSVVEEAMRQVLESTSIGDLVDKMHPKPVAVGTG